MYNTRKMHRPRSQWRSREYGFVDYATQAEAEAAIRALHATSWTCLAKDARGLIVQYAKET
jgi:hypothetical protein